MEKDYVFDLFEGLYDAGFKGHLINQVVQKQPKFHYTSIVPIGRMKNSEDNLNINFINTQRILTLGGSGSGKSLLNRAILSRLAKLGYGIFIIDIKGEYLSFNKPAQGKFHKFLIKNERPQGFGVKAFYPFFLSRVVKRKLDKNEVLCQFSLRSLNVADFFSLIGEISDDEKTCIETIWNDVMEKKIKSFSEVKNAIRVFRNLTQQSKNRLIGRVINLENNGIIGDQFDEPDIVGSLNEGNITILNVRGYTKFGEENQIASAYVALCLRQITNAKIDGSLKPNFHVVIFIDEVNKFCPKDGNPSSKTEILKDLDLTRSEKISTLFSTQDKNRIPYTIFDQCNIIIVSQLTSKTDLKEIIEEKLPQEYAMAGAHRFGAVIGEIFGDMKYYKSGARDWLYISKPQKRKVIFIPYFSLCFHQEENK